MKVIDNIREAQRQKQTLFTFELLPPLKGHDIERLYKAIDQLMEFSPSHINITYHQDEVAYQELTDGSIKRKVLRKRPGTVAIAAAIKHKYEGMCVVPHLICGGLTKEDIENILIDFHFLRINNLLLLRGDPPRGQKRFVPTKGGHAHTSELLQQILDLNQGKYLDEGLKNTVQTDFSCGVAGYPEKHIEAPNMQTDMEYLKMKVDMGADYIVTQMFFNNEAFFRFEEKCRQAGITVPIIPGLKPITMLNDLKLLPQVFNIDIPDELVKELKKCKDNKEAWQVGVDWGIHQSKELKAHGVPVLHYYTIGRSDNIQEIAKAVF